MSAPERERERERESDTHTHKHTPKPSTICTTILQYKNTSPRKTESESDIDRQTRQRAEQKEHFFRDQINKLFFPLKILGFFRA
jgi:hypothetical protein